MMKCTECGKRFCGLDIELWASALSRPLRYSKCGSVRTRPTGLFSLFISNTVYRKIWDWMDKIKRKAIDYYVIW